MFIPALLLLGKIYLGGAIGLGTVTTAACMASDSGFLRTDLGGCIVLGGFAGAIWPKIAYDTAKDAIED